MFNIFKNVFQKDEIKRDITVSDALFKKLTKKKLLTIFSIGNIQVSDNDLVLVINEDTEKEVVCKVRDVLDLNDLREDVFAYVVEI